MGLEQSLCPPKESGTWEAGVWCLSVVRRAVGAPVGSQWAQGNQ